MRTKEQERIYSNEYYHRTKEQRKDKLKKYRDDFYKRYGDDKRAYHREWCRINKVKVRDYALKRQYGISLEVYEAMVKEQNNQCAICKTNKEKFDVDHDHITGKVRGLLCHYCNVLLGQAFDNPDTLEKAATYLRR